MSDNCHGQRWRQRTPTDGLSRARDATTLAIRVCTWLPDEEATRIAAEAMVGGSQPFHVATCWRNMISASRGGLAGRGGHDEHRGR